MPTLPLGARPDFPPIPADLMTSTPPFRADHVGSFLRPQSLKAARAQREAGEITADQLKEVEDDAITNLVRQQEACGLKLATDGEFRRAWWHFDFLGLLDGVDLVEAEQGIQFAGVQTKPLTLKVSGKVDFPDDHPFLDHFRFLKATTKVTPKMTIPAPTVLHFRGGRKAISESVYPDMDGFFHDAGHAYAKAVKAFYEAGCRYLQFDDTAFAYLCSPAEREKAKQRGDDTEGLQEKYAQMINIALDAKPHDITITTHICRGNFRSTWVAEGGYEPIAETLLARCDYDGYFLEYDSERAGGFEPLRFLPKGHKRVVLGLITSKDGALESRDGIKRRIEEAGKFASVEQFCLSPQCGFASTEEGNVLTEDQQWAKMREVVAIAEEVWGA
jgi:5-methyltetrahydropteroyltriglutamate--homocysteine methyltransferase